MNHVNYYKADNEPNQKNAYGQLSQVLAPGLPEHEPVKLRCDAKEPSQDHNVNESY